MLASRSSRPHSNKNVTYMSRSSRWICSVIAAPRVERLIASVRSCSLSRSAGPDIGDDHAVVSGQAERCRHPGRDGLHAHSDFLAPQLSVLLQLPEHGSRRRARDGEATEQPIKSGLSHPSPCKTQDEAAGRSHRDLKHLAAPHVPCFHLHGSIVLEIVPDHRGLVGG